MLSNPKTRRFLTAFLSAFAFVAAAAAVSTSAAYAQDMDSATKAAQPSKAHVARKAVRQASHRAVPKGAGKYFIEFRSRYALSYGHTFLAHGRLDANGKIGNFEVAGLHPAGEGPELWTAGHVLPVPSETGPSDGDLEEEYISARYRIVLDQADYERIVAHIRYKQAHSPLWHAVMYNCNGWVGEVARYMGLKAPADTLMYPQNYINELKAMNGGTPSIPVGVAQPQPTAAEMVPQVNVAEASLRTDH